MNKYLNSIKNSLSGFYNIASAIADEKKKNVAIFSVAIIREKNAAEDEKIKKAYQDAINDIAKTIETAKAELQNRDLLSGDEINADEKLLHKPGGVELTSEQFKHLVIKNKGNRTMTAIFRSYAAKHPEKYLLSDDDYQLKAILATTSEIIDAWEGIKNSVYSILETVYYLFLSRGDNVTGEDWYLSHGTIPSTVKQSVDGFMETSLSKRLLSLIGE